MNLCISLLVKHVWNGAIHVLQNNLNCNNKNNLILGAENTYLLCKGKYHCMADLLFDRLGFGQTSKSVYSFNSTKQLNPNQSKRRSAVQWYFPLRSKWVFPAVVHLHLQKSSILYLPLSISHTHRTDRYYPVMLIMLLCPVFSLAFGMVESGNRKKRCKDICAKKIFQSWQVWPDWSMFESSRQ